MKPLSNDIDFLKFAGLQESQYLEPTTTFLEDVKKRFANGYEVQGEKLPWKKTREKVGLRDGEVSLWAGINGHGKSNLLGQVIVWLPRDVKCVIASLEMKPAATIERMCRQTMGSGIPTPEYVDYFGERTDNIWIYDQIDSVPAEKILGMCHYAAQELAVKQIMIDSLMKCGISPEDYPRQKEFVDRLCWCAKTENIHIHLVHHIRKGDKELSVPDKFDIKGAGEITDLVDNVFIVHRNKAKERAQENNNHEKDNEPDETLMVSKQRHGNWEGKVNLWWHEPSHQYVGGPDSLALRWRE